MRPFDRVVLIFNPASTGDASALAAELCAELQRRQPDLPVTLQPTEHAGHARDLARDAARTGRPLLVSVSGDGGYNEVVDGAMQAGNDAAVCAVLPAGNANDHRRATREQPLADAIVTGSVTRIDLLRLTVGGSSPTTRYAHSYVGLGLTPVVAVDVEKGGKGSRARRFDAFGSRRRPSGRPLLHRRVRPSAAFFALSRASQRHDPL